MPMIISWEGAAEIQSGDVLIVEIDDMLLLPADMNPSTANNIDNGWVKIWFVGCSIWFCSTFEAFNFGFSIQWINIDQIIRTLEFETCVFNEKINTENVQMFSLAMVVAAWFICLGNTFC